MTGKALGRIPGCALLTILRLKELWNVNSNLRDRGILMRLEGSGLASDLERLDS